MLFLTQAHYSSVEWGWNPQGYSENPIRQTPVCESLHRLHGVRQDCCGLLHFPLAERSESRKNTATHPPPLSPPTHFLDLLIPASAGLGDCSMLFLLWAYPPFTSSLMAYPLRSAQFSCKDFIDPLLHSVASHSLTPLSLAQ